MTNLRALYHDAFGDILDRADDDCVEIRWFDTSSAMTGEQFNGFLATFAGCVESAGRQGCLVDAVQFKMDMSKMDGSWRDANIIPRYNAAGVQKFAFLMPQGMPAIGSEPAPEGPAVFPTAYFASRADALFWLNG